MLNPVAALAEDFEPLDLAANPGGIGWPPTFAIEVALQLQPLPALCRSYKINQKRWDELRFNAAFQADVSAAREALKKDGLAFKMRAQLQSLGLLDTAWEMTQDKSGATPPSVRASLIQSIWRCAGLDASRDASVLSGKVGQAQVSININLDPKYNLDPVVEAKTVEAHVEKLDESV